MADKFSTYKDTKGGVTVTRKGSDYDSGTDMGNYAAAKVMKDTIEKGREKADTVAKRTRKVTKEVRATRGYEGKYDSTKSGD